MASRKAWGSREPDGDDDGVVGVAWRGGPGGGGGAFVVGAGEVVDVEAVVDEVAVLSVHLLLQCLRWMDHCRGYYRSGWECDKRSWRRRILCSRVREGPCGSVGTFAAKCRHVHSEKHQHLCYANCRASKRCETFAVRSVGVEGAVANAPLRLGLKRRRLRLSRHFSWTTAAAKETALNRYLERKGRLRICD